MWSCRFLFRIMLVPSWRHHHAPWSILCRSRQSLVYYHYSLLAKLVTDYHWKHVLSLADSECLMALSCVFKLESHLIYHHFWYFQLFLYLLALASLMSSSMSWLFHWMLDYQSHCLLGQSHPSWSLLAFFLVLLRLQVLLSACLEVVTPFHHFSFTELPWSSSSFRRHWRSWIGSSLA